MVDKKWYTCTPSIIDPEIGKRTTTQVIPDSTKKTEAHIHEIMNPYTHFSTYNNHNVIRATKLSHLFNSHDIQQV